MQRVDSGAADVHARALAHGFETFEHLDLFGHGSLYELLCRAQTLGGQARLADWLLRPATPEVIRARQGAVRELAPEVDLREDLAVLGPEVEAGVEPEVIAAWGERERAPLPDWARPLAFGLALLTAAAGVAALATGVGLAPLLLVSAVDVLFWLRWRGYVDASLHDLERPARDLALIVALLARLERESWSTPLLVELRGRLGLEGDAPSLEIARLRRLVDLLDARRNQLFAPLAPFLLWRTQFAFAIEAWRVRCGPRMAGWLDVVAELEALCDLASHAYEHPDDPFPEIADPGAGPLYRGDELGHPLIPAHKCVPNSLHLDPENALLVVSGSNMSGKSTFLRTIGSNAVLALAGAPVRAQRLVLTPFAIGASIRIVDSLMDGNSRFYAEIRCLRRIVEQTESGRPVLFLLDEILGGTNSHDRGVGAAAVVRRLVEAGAVGLVTTHDLALAKIVDELAPRAANVHFEDQLVGGRMSFDYRLREGIVRKSNALELMRAVGLQV